MTIQLSLTIDLPAHDVAADFMVKLSEAFALLKGFAAPAASALRSATAEIAKVQTARGTTAPAVIVDGEPKPADTPPAELPKPASERKPRAPKASAPAKTEEPAAAAPAMTKEAIIEELRTLGNALVNKLGGNVVRGELAKFGAARYPDLSHDDAAKLLVTFKQLAAA